MSSICCRLWRSSGSASRASSSVRDRRASIVRRLRVMLRRMKEAKMLSRRKPMPTSSTPTCHTITNSSRAPHSRDIAQVVPHSRRPQTYVTWLGGLETPCPAGGRPLHDGQNQQVVDRVQLAKGQGAAHAGNTERLPEEDGQRAQAQTDEVARRPRCHDVGELCAQQDDERGQNEHRRELATQPGGGVRPWRPRNEKGTVSMSRTAVPVPPSTVVVQTWLEYGVVVEGVTSLTLFTTPKPPMYHSRRLPPTVNVAVWVVPSLKVSTTVPTGVPAYQL